jgi:hypothetical protein
VIVVSDASPLIALAAVQQLDLLRTLYGEILIPPAVYAEVRLRVRWPRGPTRSETHPGSTFVRSRTAIWFRHYHWRLTPARPKQLRL